MSNLTKEKKHSGMLNLPTKNKALNACHYHTFLIQKQIFYTRLDIIVFNWCENVCQSTIYNFPAPDVVKLANFI